MTAHCNECTLTPEALQQRLDAWRELGRRALSRAVQPGHVVASYANNTQNADRLSELIAAERDCCPFLHFEVRVDRDVITVELRYPAELGPEIHAALHDETRPVAQER